MVQECPEEAPLIGRRRHLYRDHRSVHNASAAIERRGMLAHEFADDQRLADVGRAVHDNAGHALALWHLDQASKPMQRLDGAGMVDPAVDMQSLDAFVLRERQRLPSGWVQVNSSQAGATRCAVRATLFHGQLPSVTRAAACESAVCDISTWP